MLRLFSFCVVLCALAGVANGQEKNKIESKVADAKPICSRAAGINFYKELGVPLEYLSSIGQDIKDARLKPDPVGLALCSRSLKVAEEVSGNKASVTSDEVLKDAIHLGKLRGVSSELAALKSIVTDEATKKDLDKELQAAKEREDEAVKDAKDNTKTKELLGSLTVYNYSGECVRIYVSGRYAGVVHEGTGMTFHVHDHNHHTELAAYCLEDGELVSTDCVEGHKHRYTWVIR